ncbi:MAG TPA: DUF2934 domain-containing protein [Burkholderiales bacterium]|nr:DUF2934 domain-containing protein [Burkholderiales bacterium]
MVERPQPGQKESELTLLIAERACRLAQERQIGPGRELDLWLEAEAQVKRERGLDKTRR